MHGTSRPGYGLFMSTRRDGLADEHDDPQTHPDAAEEARIAQENAATSLDQPSQDVG